MNTDSAHPGFWMNRDLRCSASLKLLTPVVADLRADRVDGLQALHLLQGVEPLVGDLRAAEGKDLQVLEARWGEANPASPTLVLVGKSMLRLAIPLRLSSAASWLLRGSAGLTN